MINQKDAPGANGGGRKDGIAVSTPIAKENLRTRPDRPEWIRANGIGLAGEKIVADLLRRVGLAAVKLAERSADLQVFGRIEVKHDRLAERTCRVAVEVSHRGRPSGIATTSAGGWAFVLASGEVVLVNVESLRSAVANLPDVPAGEQAMVRLLPLAELRRRGVSIGGHRL